MRARFRLNNNNIDSINDEIYRVLDNIEEDYSQTEIVESLRQIYETYKYDLKQMDKVLVMLDKQIKRGNKQN